MICKFCGNLIEDNSDFCFICGQKVEAEAVAQAPVADVYSQPVQAEAPAAEYVPAPEYAQAPAYAQAPVYAQAPAYAQAPVAVEEEPKKGKKKKNKKKAEVKDVGAASKAQKIFATIFAATFILQFISWLWVRKAQKAGNDEKAAELTNSTMVGLCIFMGIACAVLIFKFMLK